MNGVGPAAESAVRWSSAGDSESAHRRWDDEVVMYADATGAVHLLPDTTWRVLQALQAWPGDSASAADLLPGSGAESEPALVEQLQALHDAGLVHTATPVPA